MAPHPLKYGWCTFHGFKLTLSEADVSSRFHVLLSKVVVLPWFYFPISKVGVP